MKITRSKSIILFVALTIAGVCLVVFGQAAADKAVSTVLPLVGSAIFGSSLTFFMVSAIHWEDSK
jgi:hypothetical protein